MINISYKSNCPKVVEIDSENQYAEFATVHVYGETWGNVTVNIDDFPAYKFRIITLVDMYEGKKPTKFIVDVCEPAPTYSIFDDPLELIEYLNTNFNDYNICEHIKYEVLRPMIRWQLIHSSPSTEWDIGAVEAKVDDFLP